MSDKTEQKSLKSNYSASETEVHIQPQTPEKKIAILKQEDANPSPLESFVKTVGEVGGTITDTALGVGVAVGGSAIDAGSAVVSTVASVREVAAKQTHKIIEQATETAGNVVSHLTDNWLIHRLAGVVNLNWLVGASDSVDLVKTEATVKHLKQKYPLESPSQLAHRIMMDKAIKAGGIGLTTSILPGAAAALLAVDFAATTELQSEMVYQIASIYGLDLQDSARKGEVLAIFGLGLGGGRLLKTAGLSLLRNIPFAGAVIGASANATMIFSLGYAACRFYETKLNASESLNSEETIAKLQEQSENYLQTAIAQEAVMDQILVHMILASHPEQTWSEILPQLEALNLSSKSLEAIEQNIKSPQPLDTLLKQLNRDFAAPLLAQCYRIAKLNNETTPVEQNIIKAITSKFDIDASSIESVVNEQ
ncbi:MAG: EcsC family protein [Cyanobacteria bacterium P01_D01_bin.116]